MIRRIAGLIVDSNLRRDDVVAHLEAATLDAQLVEAVNEHEACRCVALALRASDLYPAETIDLDTDLTVSQVSEFLRQAAERANRDGLPEREHLLDALADGFMCADVERMLSQECHGCEAAPGEPCRPICSPTYRRGNVDDAPSEGADHGE